MGHSYSGWKWTVPGRNNWEHVHMLHAPITLELEGIIHTSKFDLSCTGLSLSGAAAPSHLLDVPIWTGLWWVIWRHFMTSPTGLSDQCLIVTNNMAGILCYFVTLSFHGMFKARSPMHHSSLRFTRGSLHQVQASVKKLQSLSHCQKVREVTWEF